MATKIKNFEKNGIKTSVEIFPVEVAEIRVSDFQKKGTKTAILKQKTLTTSYYPTAQIDNEFQDNLFSVEEFGFAETEYKSERTNVAFLDVPENTTLEQLEKKLATFPDACIYRILSNRPILTSNQEYAINEGLRTLEDYANSQVVRNGETQALTLDPNGNIQYRVTFFSTTEKDDIDGRDGDVFMTPELEAEYNAALLVTA